MTNRNWWDSWWDSSIRSGHIYSTRDPQIRRRQQPATTNAGRCLSGISASPVSPSASQRCPGLLPALLPFGCQDTRSPYVAKRSGRGLQRASAFLLPLPHSPNYCRCFSLLTRFFPARSGSVRLFRLCLPSFATSEGKTHSDEPPLESSPCRIAGPLGEWIEPWGILAILGNSPSAGQRGRIRG